VQYNQAVDDWSDGIYRFILKNVRDTDLAKDLVQDTFEKFWIKREGVDDEKIKSYLFTTAYHLVVDHTRRQKFKGDVKEISNTPKVSSANYLKESSFRYVVYDYTQKEQAATLTQSQQPFSVYPNPATNEVYIWHNNEEQEAPVIKLYDNTGRLQLSVTPEPQATYKLSISNLAPGLYNLHIITNQTQQHIKLIKQ
jgi:hypothetical protein